MREHITARSYAHALLELGDENKIDVAEEFTSFNELINQNDALENLLFLEVFTPDEKRSVLNVLFEKVKTHSLLRNFVYFLIEEKRIGLLPLIFKEVIVVDDYKKGFIRGTIEGPEATIQADAKKLILDYIQARTGRKPDLAYVESKNVTAGYRVTVEDLQLDASIDNQFEVFKKSILGE